MAAAVANSGAASPSSPAANGTAPAPAAAAAPANAAPASNSGFSSASLYVGDLNSDVAEVNLFEIFNAVASVSSIRVCRDAITRRSLGYAYVNFNSHVDAEKAMDALDNTLIKGRPCRIMWSQRDPSLRRSGKNNIFIKNLAKDIDRKGLYDAFSQFGDIVSCKIELDQSGESKGYGFIQFADSESADKALVLDGKMLNDKKVYVGHFIPKKERMAKQGEQSFTNVFIKNLPEQIDDEKLRHIFSSFGPIKSAVVMKDHDGKSKGFGFVDFDEPDDAAEAVEELNDSDMDGKSVFVGRAQKKYEREAELRAKFDALKIERLSKYQGANLYVKNLDDDFNDEKLRELFAQYGTITSAVIKKDNKSGQSRGFGFVCFSSAEEATKAVQDLHGKIVGSKPLYVSLHQPKDQRRAHLENQFAQRNKMVAPRGMPTPMPVYPNGGAMFYPPGAGPAGFVYPPMAVPPRGPGRFPPGAPYGMAPAPGNYVMIPGGRGMPPKGRGGNVVPRRKGPQGQGQAEHHGAPQQVAGQQQASQQTPMEILASVLGPYSIDQQKTILGERLYPLILKSQPNLAGKITGMILDSCAVDEILPMLEKSDALDAKIEEALIALREHSAKEGGEQKE